MRLIKAKHNRKHKSRKEQEENQVTKLFESFASYKMKAVGKFKTPNPQRERVTERISDCILHGCHEDVICGWMALLIQGL